MKESNQPHSPAYHTGQRMVKEDYYITGQYPNCFYAYDCKNPVNIADWIWTEGKDTQIYI